MARRGVSSVPLIPGYPLLRNVSASGASRSQTMPSDQTEPKRPSARILVVDDEPAVSELHRKLLTREGYGVEVAATGETGLDAFEAYKPHLVLLDLVLPDISGIEVCRRIKQDLKNRLTPVIMVTGLAQREKRIEALEAGADDFLGKPTDVQELIVRVRSLVRM